VLNFLVRRELLSSAWAERILSWRHSGFSVHRRVRAATKAEAERVGKYMIRPLLALERRLSPLRRSDEGRCLPHGACRRGSHHRPPEARLCRRAPPAALRPLSGSSFGRPTLRPGSFPIPRPNIFRDRCRARGEWCVRTTASRPPEPAAFDGPGGFPALPAVL